MWPVYLSAQRFLEGGSSLIPTVFCFVVITSLINIPETLGERIPTCSQVEKETRSGANIGFTAIVPRIMDGGGHDGTHLSFNTWESEASGSQ